MDHSDGVKTYMYIFFYVYLVYYCFTTMKYFCLGVATGTTFEHWFTGMRRYFGGIFNIFAPSNIVDEPIKTGTQKSRQSQPVILTVKLWVFEMLISIRLLLCDLAVYTEHEIYHYI